MNFDQLRPFEMFVCRSILVTVLETTDRVRTTTE